MKNSRGFTLIELVIVMVITGIMAAAGILFLAPVVSGYMATQRRATLTDMADTALRKMAREVRSAVPNSIRWPGSQCFELVPTSTGGRYRMASDTQYDTPPLPCTPSPLTSCSAPLDITQPVTQFDVLSYMSVTPANNDWVVIDNQDTNDVYSNANSAQITNFITPLIATSGGTFTGLSRIAINSQQFPSGYTGGRFVVVPYNGGSPAVVYTCSSTGLDASGNGTGTLYRTPRAFISAYPATCPLTTVASSVVATNVQSCNFAYTASEDGTQQSALLWMELQITQLNESVTLDYGAHVDNVP